MSARGLVRRPSVGMAAGTAASRATGLARTIALASVLGVGTVSDAYNTANTAPNMLFALVAGGTLGAALVPMLAREEDPERTRETASVVLGTVTVWAAIVSVAMVVAAPLLMRLLAAGSGGRSDRTELLELGTTWMRTFAPQVALYAISVIATGIMSSQRRLALGATAPVATNILVIAGAITFAAVIGTRPQPSEVDGLLVAILGWATTGGVAAMAAIQLAGARRLVPGLRFTPRWRHPATHELRRIGLWTLLYVAVNQIGVGVVVALASDADGGVSAYQWAFAIMQLPYAIVAVSIYSAAYPALARVPEGEPQLRTDHVRRAAAPAVALLVPAAVALVVLADPLATVVVGSGDRELVAAGLRGFGFSLVPFVVFQLLTRTAYSRSDPRSPAVVNIVVNAVMVAVDVAVFVFAEDPRSLLAGLALGHAASYIIGCIALYWHLHRSGVLVTAGWPRLLARPIAAGLVSAAVVSPWIGSASEGRPAAIASVALWGAVGVLVYGMVGAVLGLHRTVRA